MWKLIIQTKNPLTGAETEDHVTIHGSLGTSLRHLVRSVFYSKELYRGHWLIKE